MNAVQSLNKENMRSQHKVNRIDRKDYNLKRRKVKQKVEDKIINLIIIDKVNILMKNINQICRKHKIKLKKRINCNKYLNLKY